MLEKEYSNAEYIRRSFLNAASPFSITIVKSLREARESLGTAGFDLIITDWILPDGRGIDILPRKDGMVMTPLVIMTSHGDEKLAVEMLKSGAIDYVVKSETTLKDLPRIAERVLREWENIQQRKRAEDALHESDVRYRNLHESIRDAIASVDMDGKITEINQSFREMVGYSEEELLGMNFRGLTPEKWHAAEDRIISEEVIRLGFSGIYEKEYQRKDGTVFPVELRVFLIRSADGQPAGMWAIVRDITERKRAEQDIIEREEKYRSLFAAESDAIFLIDQESGAILEANEAASRLYGFTRDELLRMNYTDVSAEPDLTEISVRETQNSISQLRHKKRDGTVFPVEISVGYFTIRARKFILGAVRDITARLQMERQLVSERENAKNLLDIAGAIILALDPEGAVTLINRKGCEILGYDREEIIGKVWVDEFLPQRIRSELKDTFRDLVDGDPASASERENPILTRSGEEKLIRWSNTAIRNSGGEITGTLSSGVDITERRRAEAALQASEESYRGLFNTIRQAILIHDQDTKIIDVNDGAVAMFGYSREEFIGKTPDFLPAPEQDLGAVYDKIRLAFSGTPQQLELLARRKNGEIFPNDIRLYKGHYFGRDVLIAIVTDITERKTAESELRKKQIMLAAAMDLSQMANWEFDVRTAMFTFDDRFYALYGTTAEREGGHRMPPEVYSREFVHPDDRAGVEEEIRKALVTTDPGYVGQMEHRIIRRDGQVRSIIARYAVIMGPDGRVAGTYGANQDITERIQVENELRRKHDELNAAYEQLAAAEEGLRENYEDMEKSRREARASADRYRNLFENMLEGFAYCQMVYDSAGNPEDFIYLNVNQAFNRIIGAGTVTNRRVTEVFPGIKEAFPHLFQIYGRVSLSGIPESFDLDFKPAGKWLHISVHSPEKGYFVAVFEDITGHKYDEDTLRLSNQMLQLSHQNLSVQPLLEKFVSIIRTYTGCDSVGIRILDDGGNIPYLAYSGFSKDFYECESPLSINTDQCMCINVIKGTTDPQLPFYTDAGSFYMNGTTRFLSTVSEEEKGKTRNVCNQVGYESVALIPVREQDRIIGLIHLADHRDDMVPVGLVRVLEKTAASIGEAIARVQVEQELGFRNAMLAAQQEVTLDGILIVGENQKVLSANRRFFEMWGIPPGLVSGDADTPVLEHNLALVADREEFLAKVNYLYEHRDVASRDEILLRDGRILDRYSTAVTGSDGKYFGRVWYFRDVTEKRAAENAVKESEQKYRSLVENVLDVVYRTDREGKVTFASRSALSLLGFTDLGEIISRPIESFWLNPSERFSMMEKMARDGFVRDYEVVILGAGGRQIPVSVSSSYYRDSTGAIAGVEGVIRDITERKRFEHALEEKQKQLSDAMDLAKLVNWEFNPETGEYTFNDRFYALYGTTAEREEGYVMPAEVYVREFVHPADAALVTDTIRRVLMPGLRGDAFGIEHRIIRRDGGIRFVMVRAAEEREVSGRGPRAYGSIQDITEQKAAEQTILEKETKFQSIFNNSSDMQFLAEITASGMPGRILDVNDSALRVLGYSKEELLSKEMLDINTPAMRDQAPTIMVEVLSKGHATIESVYLRKDGNPLPVEVGIHSVKIDNRLVGISSARDISERKRQEQALRLANQKLQLMNIVAWHDIQNKVTGLRGYVELSKDLVADAEVKSFIEKEEEVLKVIHQQIQYTKEYQEMGLKPPRWIRLPAVLSRLAAAGNRQSIITTDLDELDLFCDPVIEKAFAHLINYSLSQDPPATAIRISCREAGGQLLILYEDNGPGIPDDKKSQVFIRDVGKSASFDLFFVHDILQIADMKIRETGQPGKGARFEITVPTGNFRFPEKA